MKKLTKGETIEIQNYGIYCVMAVTGNGAKGKSAWLQKINAKGKIVTSGKDARINLSNSELQKIGYTNGEDEDEDEFIFNGYDIAMLQREIAVMSGRA
jgi:hypothetical protein